LLEIEEIDQVVINTDARSLLDQLGLPKSDRILIRDRKPGICGDDVSMNLVIQDDVQNIPADLYLMTHTTNPLLSSVTIRKALTFFYDKCALCEADSLFSVNKVQTRFYKADASPVNHDPANLIPTQDLEPWFEENSSLYVFTADSFNQTKARIGSKPVLFETPSLESLDIDTPGDWDLALLGAELLSVK
jgi:CMP-N-acetylneuraminic acid synthetase